MPQLAHLQLVLASTRCIYIARETATQQLDHRAMLCQLRAHQLSLAVQRCGTEGCGSGTSNQWSLVRGTACLFRATAQLYLAWTRPRLEASLSANIEKHCQIAITYSLLCFHCLVTDIPPHDGCLCVSSSPYADVGTHALMAAFYSIIY